MNFSICTNIHEAGEGDDEHDDDDDTDGDELTVSSTTNNLGTQ